MPRREYWFGLPALRTSARSAPDTVRDRLRAWLLRTLDASRGKVVWAELTACP
ncbi:hypothetical protein [Streptomyces sp. NPDC054804]